MFKRLLFLVLCSCVLSLTQIYGQHPSRVSIKGNLRDTAGVEVVTATVMLLHPADSTLVSFTASDKSGNFRFNSVRNEAYILKVSHIAFMPLQMVFVKSEVADVDLGMVELTPFSQVLMQVVVREAKAPIRIHGDTIEYDVSTFKVPPGSTVEDLLKRLPGIEVDASGNVTAQGKDVKRVLVDGKSFFGDDPKTVTQNLGSEAISKVQVYDERSEQAKLTGVPDVARDKSMNLELKEEYKKGAFGKVTLAGGTADRWAAKGNYNRFDEKQQLSFIGYGNNINQSGVNWDDYREFKGQTGFSGYDNGDFGFAGSGRSMHRFGGVSDVPISRDSDKGYSNNYGAGTNYNYDDKKVKFNASYFYSESTLNLDQQTWRHTFLPDSSYYTTDTLSMTDFRGNHSVSSRYEHEIDSTQSLIARVNLNVTPSRSRNIKDQYFSGEEGNLFNQLDSDNSTDHLSARFNTMVIYGKRFKKPGKAFAVSGSYQLNQSSGEEDIFSLNRFFAAGTFEEQIRQLNANAYKSGVTKSSILYSDALSKKFFVETFYNFRMQQEESNNQVANSALPDHPRIDSLSLFFNNALLYHRLGSSIRYANKGLNVSLGVAAQQMSLEGAYARNKGEDWLSAPLKRSFPNITPNFTLSKEFPNRMWLEVEYSYNITEPSMSDLQPRPIVSNPLFRTLGNPDLEPERSHSFGSSVNYWAPASFASFGANLNYELYDSRIVYNMVTEFVDSVGYRTTTKPGNLSGGDNFTGWLWTSVPIIKTVLTLNLNGSVRLGNSSAYINDSLNQTGNSSYSGGLGFNLTPGSKLQFSLNGRLSFSEITYSVQEKQNQNIQNHSLAATVRYQFMSRTFFESNFSYNLYKNDRFGFDQNIPLWNASVRRIFGAKNRLEARIAAFDIFNKRLGITQTGASNYVLQSTANTLARYYMLSVSYNIRGYDLKMQQGNRRSFF
jgi:hypothetical protein